MLPLHDMPPVGIHDCPDRLREFEEYTSKHLRRHDPTYSSRQRESGKLQSTYRINPTNHHPNKFYFADEAEKARKKLFLVRVHLPWSKVGGGASHRPIDKASLRARRICHPKGYRIHFTVSWDGITRLKNYYPYKTMEELTMEFYETFQGIPIQMPTLIIRKAAKVLRLSSQGRPGYALHRDRDVYKGLPGEMVPEKRHSEPQIDDSGLTDRTLRIVQRQISENDDHNRLMKPIFPTAENVETFMKILVWSCGRKEW